MTNLAEYEFGKDRLEALKQDELRDSQGDRNEAATRLQLIDILLFECLQWNKRESDVEDRLDRTYADYVLGSPQRVVVVEAKREGTYFSLPAGWSHAIARIDTLMEDVAVQAAIRQAMQYCQNRGVPIGAISNGHQLIAFLASRQDGLPPLEGKALVFSSLGDMHTRFRVLWDNFSPLGIQARSLYETLKGGSTPPPPEKLSQRLHDYPGFKNRNQLQASLRILGDMFLEDLPQQEEVEEEFLRAAYCESGALSQHALLSKEILRARYSALESELSTTISPVFDRRNRPTPLLAEDILAASANRRPIILLGDVGVGKTAFIRHLIKIDAADILGTAVVLYVDYGRRATLAEDELHDFMLDEFSAQLRDRYGIDTMENGFARGVHHGELKRFETGIHSSLRRENPAEYELKELSFLEEKLLNKAAHLKACIEHIYKGHRRQIVIFLDNIDQRPASFQEKVFLTAEELADSWPGTVFVSIRPSTFYSSRVRGTLTAYQPRAFTVAPPRIDLVVTRRLRFALKEMRGEGSLGILPNDVTLRSESLAAYVGALLNTFGRTHDPVVEFLENASGGNVRIALDMISAFVGSGHVETEKIVRVMEEDGTYVVPLHEFLRAVLFGDHVHFEPNASQLANVFDISARDGREHFLLLILLAQLDQNTRTEGEEGFVPLSPLFEMMQNLGFHETQVHYGLRRALLKRLIDGGSSEEQSLPTRCRLTTVGAYTYKRLPNLFTYLDAMIVDTPIVNETVRQQVWDSRTLDERFDRAKVFLQYLDEQWEPLAERQLPIDWLTYKNQLRCDIDRAAAGAARRRAGKV